MNDPTLKQVLQLAVINEQNGERFYQGLALRYRNDPEVHRIFKRLADDEAAHEAQFQKLMDAAEEDKPADRIYEQADYLRALSISKFFKKDAFKDLDAIKSPEDALVNALEFEKSTLFYYQGVAEVFGDTPELKALIQAEKEHVTTLMKAILTEARFRTLADNWP